MDVLIFIAAFAVIALAARQIGEGLSRTGLPLISGFLFTGIICGPYALDLITAEAVASLRFVDEVALGIIAFAAGGELHFREMKRRMRDIAWITTGLVACTFTLTGLVFFLLTRVLPFSENMSLPARIGVSLLAGAICVARSPSSAIAIVNELRARGPFTQTVLGVTVIMDVVVITLFAANSSIADALFTGLRFNFGFVLLLAAELAGSLAAGLLVHRGLAMILRLNLPPAVKLTAIPVLGFFVFEGSGAVRALTHARLPFEVLLEPLLICMIAGFVTGNVPGLRKEFLHLLGRIGPPLYIAFFTLTGASLALDVLSRTWHVALLLFLVRGIAIFAGSFLGGLAAGLPARQSAMGWMAYITQAGVGLGLAREVVVAFPEWGMSFATVMIAVIFLNQLLGPPLFKRAIRLAGEDHPRAKAMPRPELQNAMIVGSGTGARALCRSLAGRGWTVTLAAPAGRGGTAADDEIPLVSLPVLDLDSLVRAGADNASAIVTLMSDEENYRVCELAWEHLGTQTLAARVADSRNIQRFEALGVMVADPAGAVVHLMDFFVRSPVMAAVLSGRSGDQKLTDLYMMNPGLAGVALRDVKLPIDILILSIRRKDRMVLAHDFTRLALGDRLSLLGSAPALRAAALKFDANAGDTLARVVEGAVPPGLGKKPGNAEVRQAINAPESSDDGRFRRLVRDCDILDLKEEMAAEAFFKAAGAALCGRLGLSPSDLAGLMQGREAEVSTVIAPGLAVPHIVVPGEGRFELLPVRARKGIFFDPGHPPVHAAFVLAGSADERRFHLYALSAIAKTGLDPRFEAKWLRAGNKAALRRILGTVRSAA